ncbi:hypothetical protein ACQKKX_02270 [Neorhizobium sp. NPDC001467]|uniref:hypothetical protein n=1 Tax=Neorhizobium sp. NPDC001467 TaxID=3390595 RepID=UPI003D076598
MSKSLSTAREIVADIRKDGAVTVNQQLEALITRFAEAAHLIDPAIRDVWVYRAGGDLKTPSGVVIDREATPFVKRASA